MTQQQRKTIWDNFISGAKMWIVGFFKPANALQIVIGLTLFVKMSYNGVIATKDFVGSVKANAENIAIVKIDRYADSVRQSIIDNRQDTSIQGLRNSIVKQP